jgi:hypothetical protein
MTTAVDGVSGQRHVPAALYPWESTNGTHWIGGWVCFRAGLDTEARGKILCLCQGSNLNRKIVQSVVRINGVLYNKYCLRNVACAERQPRSKYFAFSSQMHL